MLRVGSCRGQDSCYVPGLTEALSHRGRANKFLSGTNNCKTGTRLPSPMEPGPGPGSLPHSLVLSALCLLGLSYPSVIWELKKA